MWSVPKKSFKTRPANHLRLDLMWYIKGVMQTKIINHLPLQKTVIVVKHSSVSDFLETAELLSVILFYRLQCCNTMWPKFYCRTNYWSSSGIWWTIMLNMKSICKIKNHSCRKSCFSFNPKVICNISIKRIKGSNNQSHTASGNRSFKVPFYSISKDNSKISNFSLVSNHRDRPQCHAFINHFNIPKSKSDVTSAYRHRTSLTLVINELFGQFLRHTVPSSLCTILFNYNFYILI